MVNHFIYLFRPSNHLVLPRLHHPIKHSSLVNPQDSAGVVQLGMEIRQMLTAVLQIGVNHQDSAVVVQLGLEIRQMLTMVLQIGVNPQDSAVVIQLGMEIRQMLTMVLQIGVNHQDSAVVVQLGMEIRQMLATVLQIGVNTQNLAAEVAVGLQIGTHPFQTEEFLAPIEVHQDLILDFLRIPKDIVTVIHSNKIYQIDLPSANQDYLVIKKK